MTSLVSGVHPFSPSAQAASPVEESKQDNDESSVMTVEATASRPEQQKFEWNVTRLFVHNQAHSMARTWGVRVLSLLIGLPTLLLDLGRRLAFAVSMVNGKSFSLIDKTLGGCKTLSDKVSSAYHSCMNPDKKFESLASKLVEGYKVLNKESHFGTNRSGKAETLITETQKALTDEIKKFVERNAQTTRSEEH